MSPEHDAAPADVDHARLFATLPTPYMVLTPDLVVLDANPAFLVTLGVELADMVGRPLFAVFPPPPEALDAQGVSRVQRSMERAVSTKQPDTTLVDRFDVRDPATGELVERYWSLVQMPVLGADGEVRQLLQRIDDVTDWVRARGSNPAQAEVDASLWLRTQEVQRARDAERAAATAVAVLADVALGLADVTDVAGLTDVVAGRGLTALGAQGGAVAVLRGDVLELTMTEGLGEQTSVAFAEVPLDGPLPASVSTAEGRHVLLADVPEALAFTSEMEQAVRLTGAQAFAALPLVDHGQVLGSLGITWHAPQVFSPTDLEVYEALAAMCAQALVRVQARQVERASAADAVRMSEALQRSLLTEPQQPDHLHVVVRYRPAAEQAQVGGDWYDCFVTSAGITSLVVGDISGHDRESAAVMGQVRNLLRGIAYTIGEPARAVLSALDRAMRDLDVRGLATAVLATVEQTEDEHAAGTRRLQWSNAGHPPPVLVHPDGRVELLRAEPDLLLGLDADTPRSDHEVDLLDGAVVLMYTDGLVERRDASIDDGLDWLVSAVADLGRVSPDALCDALLAQVDGHTDDDVVLLALHALPQGQPRAGQAGRATHPATDRWA